MARPVNHVARSRREALMQRIRGFNYRPVGTRVKMDGRVFFVRVARGTGHIRIIERFLINVGEPTEQWAEKQHWCDTARMGPLVERILTEAENQKRSKP